ncbi:hypothetical protein CAOG_08419, partial [Capsaspora owczarzaki ATCC 30864]
MHVARGHPVADADDAAADRGAEISVAAKPDVASVSSGVHASRSAPAATASPAPRTDENAAAAASAAAPARDTVVPAAHAQLAGSVWAWGNPTDGQLGLRLTNDHTLAVPEPTELEAFSSVSMSTLASAIACGRAHTLFLVDGQVYSCGSNDQGQLGHKKHRSKPERVDALEPYTITQIACGETHSLALTSNGQVFAWGDNKASQLGLTPSESSRQPSTRSSAPKTAAASIDDVDELDAATLAYMDFMTRPRLVRALTGHKIVQIVCGANFSLVLSERGDVFAWGDNTSGQLCLRELKTVPVPTLVKELYGIPIRQLAAGGRHTLALTFNGQVYSWGNNQFGQLGVGDTAPHTIPSRLKTLEHQFCAHIACGEDHSVVLTETGGVYSFGAGGQGQLGHGTLQNEINPRMIFELMGKSASQVLCGRRHTIVFFPKTNKIYAFGLGGNGQLGTGVGVEPQQHVLTPMLVRVLDATPILRIATGASASHCFAVVGNRNHVGAAESAQLPWDARHRQASQSPLVLTLPLVRKLLADAAASKDVSALTRTLQVALSSASCLNGSFLAHEPGQELGPSAASNTADAARAFGAVVDTAATALKSAPSAYPAPAPAPAPMQIEGQPSGAASDSASGSSSQPFVPFDAPDTGIASLSSPEHAGHLDSRTDDHPSGLCLQHVRLFWDALRAIGNTTVNDVCSKALLSLVVSLSQMPISNLDTCKLFLTLLEAPVFATSLTPTAETMLSAISLKILEFVPRVQELLRYWWYLLPAKFFLRQVAVYQRFLSHLIDTARFKDKTMPDTTRYKTLVRAVRLIEMLYSLNEVSAGGASVLGSAVAADGPNQLRTSLTQWSNRTVNITSLETASRAMTNALSKLTKETPPLGLSKQSGEGATLGWSVHDEHSHALQLNSDVVLSSIGQTIVPRKAFNNSTVCSSISLVDDYAMWCTVPQTFSFCQYAFFYDADAKAKLLQIDAQNQMARKAHEAFYMNVLAHLPASYILGLSVRRNNLVQDTLDQIMSIQPSELKKPLKVQFVGEDGVDAGGVRKEFLQLLLREILDPKYGMFVSNPRTRLLWFSGHSFEAEHMFRLIGMLFSLAIYNSIIIDAPFPSVLYKKLLNRIPVLEDLEQVDPDVYRNLKYLLSCPADEVTDLALTFAVSTDNFGEVVTYELVPNGGEISVTADNRRDYVTRHVDFCSIAS